MRTSWEKTKGAWTHYVNVEAEHVTVGQHGGSGHTDNAGRVTHEQFLGGQYHDQVRSVFGPAALAEIVAAVQSAGAHPPFVEQRRIGAAAARFLDEIPPDPTIAALLDDDAIVSGFQFYGRPHGVETELRGPLHDFHVRRSRENVMIATITTHANGAEHTLRLPGVCSSVVSPSGVGTRARFYLVSARRLFVVDPDATVRFSCDDIVRRLGADVFAAGRIEMNDVLALGETVLVACRAQDPYRRATLRLDPTTFAFTGRLER